MSEEVQDLELRPEYEKIIRDPSVLEFLDLEKNPNSHFCIQKKRIMFFHKRGNTYS